MNNNNNKKKNSNNSDEYKFNNEIQYNKFNDNESDYNINVTPKQLSNFHSNPMGPNSNDYYDDN